MEKKRAVILFADIQGSTRFGYTQDVEPYNEMIRDYHRTVRDAVDEYCQKYGLDRARLTCSVKGDECCMFLTGGKPGEDEEHALRLAVYLKERWKQSDFVVRIQKAADTSLYPQVDLRIGIGTGEVALARDCWTGKDTFEGIRISEAKRIEGMADQARETLIMVKWEVRDACQRAGLEVEFGEGRRLAGKGIPEGVDLAVYPVLKYGPWAEVQRQVRRRVPRADKPAWARVFDEALALTTSGDYDQAVEAFRKAVELRPDAHTCFICYGQPDLEFAQKLYKDLKANGLSPWLYDIDATVGQRAWKEISLRRREAGRIIVLCSADALVRDDVLKQIEEQIDEDPEKIVPVSLDELWKHPGFKVVRGNRDLKPFLLDRNYADFANVPYEEEFDRLLEGLKR